MNMEMMVDYTSVQTWDIFALGFDDGFYGYLL